MHQVAESVVSFGPEREVKVIGHETKSKDTDRELSCGLGEEPDKSVVVTLIVENLRAPVAAVEGMIDKTCGCRASGARHEIIVAKWMAGGKGK